VRYIYETKKDNEDKAEVSEQEDKEGGKGKFDGDGIVSSL